MHKQDIDMINAAVNETLYLAAQQVNVYQHKAHEHDKSAQDKSATNEGGEALMSSSVKALQQSLKQRTTTWVANMSNQSDALVATAENAVAQAEAINTTGVPGVQALLEQMQTALAKTHSLANASAEHISEQQDAEVEQAKLDEDISGTGSTDAAMASANAGDVGMNVNLAADGITMGSSLLQEEPLPHLGGHPPGPLSHPPVHPDLPPNPGLFHLERLLHSMKPTPGPTMAPTVASQAPTGAPTVPATTAPKASKVSGVNITALTLQLSDLRLGDEAIAKIQNVAFEIAKPFAVQMVTQEHAAYLRRDTVKAALKASEHLRHVGADQVARKAAVLVKQAPDVLAKLAGQVVDRAETDALNLAHEAARHAVEQAITGAASSRMAELPYEEMDAAIVDHPVQANQSHHVVPELQLLQSLESQGAGTQSLQELLGELRKQRSKLRTEVQMQLGAPGAPAAQDATAAEEPSAEAPAPAAPVAAPAAPAAPVAAPAAPVAAPAAPVAAPAAPAAPVAAPAAPMAAPAAPVAAPAAPVASQSDSLDKLMNTLHSAKQDLSSEAKETPEASDVSGAIEAMAEKKAWKQEARAEVAKTGGDRAAIAKLQEHTRTSADEDAHAATQPIKDSAAALQARVIAAKARLKASAWLAQLAPHTSAPPDQVPALPAATFDADQELGSSQQHFQEELTQAKAQLKHEYDEKLRESEAEQQRALQEAKGKAQETRKALSTEKEAAKAKLDVMTQQLEQLKTQKKSEHQAYDFFKQELMGTQQQMQQEVTKQMQGMRDKTKATIQQMRAAQTKKEADLKAKYEKKLASVASAVTAAGT